MNGKNGKQSDYPEIALVPYPVIVAASKGDPDGKRSRMQKRALPPKRKQHSMKRK